MKLISQIDSATPAVARVSIVDNAGVATTKHLSIDALANILASESDRAFGPMVCNLPESLISFRIAEDGNGGVFALYVPGGKKYMLYSTEKSGKRKLVAFPPLVMFFRIENWRITRSSCFAVQEKLRCQVTLDTELFNYPYGNVSPYSGKICWGGNRLEKLSSIRELEQYVGLFLTSQTNNDLFFAGTSVQSYTLVSLIAKMSKEEVFDTALLVSSGSTVKVLIEAFTSGKE